MDSLFRYCGRGDTHRHTGTNSLLAIISGECVSQKLAAGNGSIPPFPEKQKKALFPSTFGMDKKDTLWSPSEERISQSTHTFIECSTSNKSQL